MTSLFGINIIVNELAYSYEPIRKHKKRRNQTNAYHARIQKKWSKRYGWKQAPAAIFFNPAALGLGFGGPTVAMPEKYAVLLKNFV